MFMLCYIHRHFQMFPDLEFNRQALRMYSITHCRTNLLQTKHGHYSAILSLFAQYLQSKL